MESKLNSIEIYRSKDGTVQLNVKLENESVWLTQSQMAELFGVDRTSIVRHIRNIYKSEELDESSTCAKSAQVRMEGQRQIVREIPLYNLDVIISVGYRVKSIQGTRFRQWATERLNEYIVKGFTMDDERLKNLGGGNYWKESCKISCTMLLMGIQRQKLSMSVRMPSDEAGSSSSITLSTMRVVIVG